TILASDSQMAQVKHTKRDNIDAEYEAILSSNKDIPENVNKSLAWLSAQSDYTQNCTLYENARFGFAINSTAYQDTADFFWSHYSKEEDSWRDQPMWCYSLHHTGTRPLDLSKNLFCSSEERKGMGNHTYTDNANDDALKAVQLHQFQGSENRTMRILCTSNSFYMERGSYDIRCRDLAKWAQQCAPSVEMRTGLTLDKAQQLETKYDVTLITKIVAKYNEAHSLPDRFGKVFIDLVDNYKLERQHVSPNYTLILQSDLQKGVFPNHNYE
ncbi:MAG: hypothetical protein SGILL_004100, partial [Bacillariaceae sp.]